MQVASRKGAASPLSGDLTVAERPESACGFKHSAPSESDCSYSNDPTATEPFALSWGSGSPSFRVS